MANDHVNKVVPCVFQVVASPRVTRRARGAVARVATGVVGVLGDACGLLPNVRFENWFDVVAELMGGIVIAHRKDVEM